MSQPIEFCHIVPKKLVPLVMYHPRHLVLAHLVESDPEYVELYRKVKQYNPNCQIIMDNSAFERYKAGLPMFESDKLIELGKKIGADYIVMSDYPNEDWTVTRDKAIEMAPLIKQANFKTMYVPQSKLGDIDGWCESVEWALYAVDTIDLIGISILACPIALGLQENHYGETVDSAYKMQRYLSRYVMLNELHERKIIEGIGDLGYSDFNRLMYKRFHMLGMTEGPNEIELVKNYHQLIASWDSSTAAWNAINNNRFDNSPTGLRNGKLETEVDFNWNGELSEDILINVMHNTNYIDQLCINYQNYQKEN